MECGRGDIFCSIYRLQHLLCTVKVRPYFCAARQSVRTRSVNTAPIYSAISSIALKEVNQAD